MGSSRATVSIPCFISKGAKKRQQGSAFGSPVQDQSKL